MAQYQIPELPAFFRASELLHGDNDGFIINAYLALQRHWPDNGGFFHYQDLLRRDPSQRPEVLRTLAGSETAQHVGARFEDDLPAGYAYDPACESTEPARAQYEATSLKLRLAQVVHDSRSLREALAGMTLDTMSEVVQTLVSQSRDTVAMLESRLNTVEGEAEALRQVALAPAQPPAVELAWMRQELARMNSRVMSLEQQVREQAARPTWPAEEFSELRDGFKSLHWFTTVDLKRLVADYVIAYVDARASATEDIPPTGAHAPKAH